MLITVREMKVTNGSVSHTIVIILKLERAKGHKWPYITNLFMTEAAALHVTLRLRLHAH